jgi:chromosome segregation ATPase
LISQSRGLGDVYKRQRWYLSNDKEAEDRMKKLETEYKDLQSKKDSSDIKISTWKSKFDSIRGQDVILKQQADLLARQTYAAEVSAAKSKAQLEIEKSKAAAIKADIDKFEKDPPNRTGNDLIQSLKNKLK